MKKPIEQRREVIQNLLNAVITVKQAMLLLSCSRRTIERYRKAFVEKADEGLKDHRHSNNYKLYQKQRDEIIQLKKTDRWRSARNIRDKLKLSVSEIAVGNILRGQGLTRENNKRVKAIIRFEAKFPNELWQTELKQKEKLSGFGNLSKQILSRKLSKQKQLKR